MTLRSGDVQILPWQHGTATGLKARSPSPDTGGHPVGWHHGVTPGPGPGSPRPSGTEKRVCTPGRDAIRQMPQVPLTNARSLHI